MVEKYKREGIDIVLGSRKCIYTDEKNKKFIKQNKKYIPIIKRKGEYVIINRKGGGLESSKIINDIKNLNEKIESNNAMIADINNKSTKKTSNVDEERIIKITIENTKMLSSVNEKKDEYNIQMSFETYDNIKEKVIEKTRDEEKETSDKKRVIEKEKQDKEAIEKNKLKTEKEKQDKEAIEKNIEIERKIEREKEKIPEKLKESIPPHSSNEEIDEKIKLESDIVKHIKNTELLRKDIIKNMTIPMTITTATMHNKKIELQSMREKSEKLKQEAWNKKFPNPEKEQFLKEITEKEELVKSLQENHTQYINKMIREEIYLDNYLTEKNNDIDLDFINEVEYPFLLELLLKRIIDLEKRIDMKHN